MKKIDHKLKCPKCSFEPGFHQKWKLEYKDQCYTVTCGWTDKSIKEHVHQICPDCGYTIAVACDDHETVTGNTWDVSAPAPAPAPAPVAEGSRIVVPSVAPSAFPRVIGNNSTRSVFQPVTYAPQPSAWDTECPGCPSAKKVEVV